MSAFTRSKPQGTSLLPYSKQIFLLLLMTIPAFVTSTFVAFNNSTAPMGAEAPDWGEYSIDPIQDLGTAMTRELGSLIESHRLADYVTGPWEIDPTLTREYSAMSFDGGGSIDTLLPLGILGAALRHRYIAGFSSSRSNGKGQRLQNAVLEFPSTISAESAMQEIIELASIDNTLAATPSIATHPHVSSYTWKRGPSCYCGGQDTDTLLALSAHDRYIFVQNVWVTNTSNLDDAAALVAETVDLQTSLINQFTPTPADRLSQLQVDPTGLLSRTVPVSTADAYPNGRATYGIRGTLHFDSDPIRYATIFREAGLIRTAVAAAHVYEAQSADGAKRIAEEFYAEASQDGVPRGTIENVPGSSCVSLPYSPDEILYCNTHVGRFAIDATGDERDAKQILAAQYVLLSTA